jgi:predicted membrane channel-forming protein YqfA (hemolysin III family)
MKVFRALGSGLFLLILASLLPTVFSELSRTLVVILQSSQKAFAAAGILASYAANIPPPP